MQDFVLWLLSAAATTQEYQRFGLNALSLGAILAVGTFVLEIFGLSKQIVLSWSPSKEVSVVSITKKCVLVAYFFTVFNYGLTINSLSLWGSIIIGILQLVIVVELWRLKGLKWWEWLAAFGCLVIIGTSFMTEWKTELFFFVSVVLLPPGLAMQPIEMLKTKRRSGLAVADPLSFLISASIWVFYALTLGSRLIAGVSLLYALIYAWTLYLWKRYEPKT